MIPTFTLSKNDLAYLLFRTLAIPSLRQLQGLVLSLSSPFLMIGEHRWLQRNKAKNHQNREFAVREDYREAVITGFHGRPPRLQRVTGYAHAGVFFIQGSSCWWHMSLCSLSSRVRLMGLHLRGSATMLRWTISRREHARSSGLLAL
jgi:hypothetical protein